MAYIYVWTGTNGSAWGDFLNWQTQSGVPAPGSDFFTDTTAVFDQGAVVTGPGSANFITVAGDATFTGNFSAVGQPAYGLSPFYSALLVTGGTATFGGAGTTLTTHANVLVGYGDTFGASPAELDIANGAQATFNTDNVIDINQNRIHEYSLYVGYDTTGSVNITGGSSVTTDSGVSLALDIGSSGSLHVGGGSTLHIGYLDPSYGFAIGTYGAGTLLIDGGAKVQVDSFANIGNFAGSSGVSTVDGAGSDLHVYQSIGLGYFAQTTGELTISNQGAVETDASFKIGAGGTLNLLSGGTLTSTGASGIGARFVVQDQGLVNIGGGYLVAAGNNADPSLVGVQVNAGGLITGVGTVTGTVITNDGTIEANVIGATGTLLLNSLTAAIADPGTPGILAISGNATLEVRGGVAASETVVFNNTAQAGYHENLRIDGALSAFHAPISGLQVGDAIDLADVGNATTWSLNSTTGLLSVEDASGVALGALQLLGNFAGASFALGSDGHGGFALTEKSGAQAPIFTSGGGARSANYVINEGQSQITTLQASGTDVQYFIKDPKSGKLVTSTKVFTVNSSTGQLSFTGSLEDGGYSAVIVAKNSAGQTTQNVSVEVEDHVLWGSYGQADTFVFHPGFKTDLVLGFQATNAQGCGLGSQHDVLQLDHALFAGAAAGETGSALIALLQGHVQGYGAFGSVLNTDTGEHILLSGVSKQTLFANATADVCLT